MNQPFIDVQAHQIVLLDAKLRWRVTVSAPQVKSLKQLCGAGVLEKSHIGAKSDFEIWAFKGFFSLDQKKGPKEGFYVATPKNL